MKKILLHRYNTPEKLAYYIDNIGSVTLIKRGYEELHQIYHKHYNYFIENNHIIINNQIKKFDHFKASIYAASKVFEYYKVN